MKFTIGQIVHARYAFYPSPDFDPRKSFNSSSNVLPVFEGQPLRIVDYYNEIYIRVSTELQDIVWMTEDLVISEDGWLEYTKIMSSPFQPLDVQYSWGHNFTGTNHIYIPNVTVASDYISIGATPATITSDTIVIK